jgi:DNA-binding NtrC family response regulator
MTDGRILIIDDDEDILLTLRMLLKKHVAFVRTESNPFHIPRLLRQEDFDLALLDMNFRAGQSSGSEGLQWLEKIRELSPQTQVIMITAHAEVDLAVEAIKRGAMDFIGKPWRNEKLLATVKSALRLSASEQKVEQLSVQQAALQADLDQPFGTMIGRSPAMQAVAATIGKVAVTDANVLILGENGTGKELVARAIHRQSARADAVFLGVDLGAIPDNLFESELFGHRKGAFTDAHTDRAGRFEAASGGSLFLDEIGNLPLPLQAKLLAALQNRAVRRLGDNQAIPVDIRLIAATNQPLRRMVAEGTFRQDLLYRINTVEIHLPPLRDRGEDILLLAGHFLGHYARKYAKGELALTAAAREQLLRYPWPGNVRELQHTIERAVILGSGPERDAGDFPFEPAGAPAAGQNAAPQALSTLNLEDLEREAIQQALRQHQGNISKAAEVLGLTRGALYRRLDKYGL